MSIISRHPRNIKINSEIITRSNENLKPRDISKEFETLFADTSIFTTAETGTAGASTTKNSELLNKNRQIIPSTFKLDYDPLNPPVNVIISNTKFDFSFIKPHTPKPTVTSIPLIIPEFVQNSKVSFELPVTAKTKISKCTPIHFTPAKNQATSLSEGYADSVNWSNKKIARDFLQNFYDGHGQTLDGVKIEIEPEKSLFSSKPKYRIKITGKSEYTPDKALLIGESSKREDSHAAGNFGEGLKISILKILKDSNIDEVKLGSNNWELTYKLQKNSLNSHRVLGYTLDEAQGISGNYLEFKTDDTDLINSFKEAVNYFYHSENEDFKNLTFENNFIGIKKLKQNETGAVYIAGQRLEFNGDWHNLNGFSIFFKEKPPREILDISRDRLSLNESCIKTLLTHFGKQSSKEELAEAILALESCWTSDDKIANAVIAGFCDAARSKFMKFEFPSNYICKGFTNISPDLHSSLVSNGYKICGFNMVNLGMENIVDFMKKSRNHNPLAPTTSEIQKIGIIKKALANLQSLLQNNILKEEEMNPHIYIFDNKSTKESQLAQNYRAEAIIDNIEKKSLGFWINKEYLDQGSFSEVLGTTLHELCHKAGGDGTAQFSYLLTDAIKEAFRSLLSDPNACGELKRLNLEWTLLSK